MKPPATAGLAAAGSSHALNGSHVSSKQTATWLLLLLVMMMMVAKQLTARMKLLTSITSNSSWLLLLLLSRRCGCVSSSSNNGSGQSRGSNPPLQQRQQAQGEAKQMRGRETASAAKPLPSQADQRAGHQCEQEGFAAHDDRSFSDLK